jgi:hypothetical protein
MGPVVVGVVFGVRGVGRNAHFAECELCHVTAR